MGLKSCFWQKTVPQIWDFSSHTCAHPPVCFLILSPPKTENISLYLRVTSLLQTRSLPFLTRFLAIFRIYTQPSRQPAAGLPRALPRELQPGVGHFMLKL